MTDDLDASWDEAVAAADDADAVWADPAQSWVPPNLGVLMRAVRRTSLRRLFPFTSHALLCLSDRADFWKTGADGGHVAPAFVSRTREQGFLIWSGNPYHTDEAELVLATNHPEAAASRLELLVADWPA